MTKNENETQHWFEGEGYYFDPFFKLNDEQIATGEARIAVALARNGQSDDEALKLDFRSRLHHRKGELYLKFATSSASGFGFALLDDAINLLLDPKRSPEEALRKKQLAADAAKRNQENDEIRANVIRKEREQKQTEEREKMERRLEAWNAVPRLEQACRLLGVLSPAHGEIAEALLMVFAIQDQLPQRWVTPPPCDVDLVMKTFVDLNAIQVEESAAEGRTLLRNLGNELSLPSGLRVPHGAVVEVGPKVLENPSIKAWMTGGLMQVVESARFVMKDWSE